MIVLPASIRDAMIQHAVGELPNEACGLLAGRDGRVERYYPIRNDDQSGFTYRLDGKQQMLAEEDAGAQGWEITGVFHSHTHTAPYPSPTDRRLAFWPDPERGQRIYRHANYFILSLKDEKPELRTFWIEDADQVEEQEVRFE